MSLPPEVLDHIFSFLQSDIVTLKACAQSHPLLLHLVAPHLYAKIILYASEKRYYNYHNDYCENDEAYVPRLYEFIQVLSATPQIGNYVRTVKIVIPEQPSYSSGTLANISSALQRLFSLKKLAFVPSMRCLWKLLPEGIRQAFLKCISLPSMEELSLVWVEGFPLSAIKTIKKLVVRDCWKLSFDEPSPDQSVESLSLIECQRQLFLQIIPWVTTVKLRSLALFGFKSGFEMVSQLIASCPNSLTTLHVDIEHMFTSRCKLSEDMIAYTTENNRIPINLYPLIHLKDLTIYANATIYQSVTIPGQWMIISAIPAIAKLLETTSSLQHFTLNFLLYVERSLIFFSPSHVLDWSILVRLLVESSASSFRVDIKWAEGVEDGRHTHILASFARCTKLKQMVDQGVLVITPQIPADL